ncbi:MAG TPA: glycosyltransferase family 1 protein [Patescibacteria group bacterium]|nr:glycosyltransferase family 1 protein [Patescibacteria group bacterium]
MRIGFDLRSLPSDGSAGAGVAHAAHELWTAVLKRQSEIEWIGFAPKGAAVESSKIVWLKNSSGASLRSALKSHPVDALFVASGAVPLGLSIPVYPWVHDLAIFSHPNWFPQSWFKRQLTTRLFLRGLRQAAHLFAVSENTKREIKRVAGIPEKKISVLYQGTELKFRHERRQPYALIMGTVEPRKNIPFILKLWPKISDRIKPEPELIIAGANGWGSVPIPENNLIRRIERISNADVAHLTAQAMVALVPSFYEGFGRGALDAMALGTPVITSDQGALPEVIGTGGQIISLNQPDQWVKAICRLFKEPEEVDYWSKAGLKRAEDFSWERSATKLINFLLKNRIFAGKRR